MHSPEHARRSHSSVHRRPLPADPPVRRGLRKARGRHIGLAFLGTVILVAATLFVVLALSGCGGADQGTGGTGAEGDGSITHPQGSAELVLRMEVGGGFVPVEIAFSNLPYVSIYGDGSVITQGPVPAIFPGPALPNLQVASLSEAGLQVLLSAARDAGLLETGIDYGQPLVADASTTTFTIVADGQTFETPIYHLSPENSGDGALTSEQKESRAKALDFQVLLYDLRGVVGDELGPDGSYEWKALTVLIQPADPDAQDPSGLEPGILEWPLGDLATIGDENPLGRVVTVSGADLDTLMPLAREANQMTLWQSGDSYYRLAFRPLLPDQAE